MKIQNGRINPTPTPRDAVIPGLVYRYEMGIDEFHYVLAISDPNVFGEKSTTFLVDLVDGTTWAGDSGELYLVDAVVTVKEVAP